MSSPKNCNFSLRYNELQWVHKIIVTFPPLSIAIQCTLSPNLWFLRKMIRINKRMMKHLIQHCQFQKFTFCMQLGVNSNNNFKYAVYGENSNFGNCLEYFNSLTLLRLNSETKLSLLRSRFESLWRFRSDRLCSQNFVSNISFVSISIISNVSVDYAILNCSSAEKILVVSSYCISFHVLSLWIDMKLNKLCAGFPFLNTLWISAVAYANYLRGCYLVSFLLFTLFRVYYSFKPTTPLHWINVGLWTEYVVT